MKLEIDGEEAIAHVTLRSHRAVLVWALLHIISPVELDLNLMPAAVLVDYQAFGQYMSIVGNYLKTMKGAPNPPAFNMTDSRK